MSIHAGQQLRLHVLCGDLAKPNFGRHNPCCACVYVCSRDDECVLAALPGKQYNQLVASLRQGGVILHSGAWVNMVLPYSALRAVNVGGTLEILKLAVRSGCAVMYMSSVGAIGVANKKDNEWQCLSAAEIARKGGGYAQSKAVAERLFFAATEQFPQHVRGAVFRPSAICGHTRTGFSNVHDLTNLLLSAIVDAGCYPLPADLYMRWIPVDFVSAAMLTIADMPQPAKPAVYHLCGRGPPLSDVLAVLEQRGHVLAPVTFKEWCSALDAKVTNKSPAYPVLDALKQMDFHDTEEQAASVGVTRTRAALQRQGVPWPAVDSGMIVRYIERLEEDGVIAKPSAAH